MTAQQDDVSADDDRELEITDYLRAHPDFFDRHPEALAAIDPLRESGILVNVFNVTGPGPLFTQFQRAAVGQGGSNPFDALVPPGGGRKIWPA